MQPRTAPNLGNREGGSFYNLLRRSREGETKKEFCNKSFKKKSQPWKKTDNQYPGPAPIKLELLEKHSRGDGIQTETVKTKYWQKMAKRREDAAQAVQEATAR